MDYERILIRMHYVITQHCALFHASVQSVCGGVCGVCVWGVRDISGVSVFLSIYLTVKKMLIPSNTSHAASFINQLIQ